MSKHTIDRQALTTRIRQLEGLTNDEKAALLELLNTRKKYGLVWEDKPEQVEEELRSKIPVFTEVKDRAIINDTPNEHYPNHLLIEGDNLQALTTLAYTHEGKIDVIYIDPPYNTGNKDFVYNDRFVDSEDSYRHSKWLSFMSKRLEIAKRLLSDKGVIFISIDDNEQANLKLLCDEVFGEDNLIADFIIIRSEGGGLAKQAVIGHDYLLTYAKCKSDFTPLKRDKDIRGKIIDWNGEKYWIETDWLRKEFGKYGTCFYEDILKYYNLEKKQEIDKKIVKGEYRLIENGNKHVVGRLRKVAEDGSKLYTIQKHLNKEGLVTLEKLGLSKKFTFPKPVSLIKEMVYGATFFKKDKRAVVLDFFAGSGTTLHSIVELNKRDGGQRQCILVTNNENNICEEVTYERNKRVINGYTTPKGEQVEGLLHNNLRYYKTELVERENSQQNRKALMKASADLLCIKEDIYTEKDELNGTKFNKQYIRFYQDGDRSMLLVFDPRAIDTVVERLGGMAFVHPVKVYVYSADEYPYTDDFAPVADKVQLVALPTALRKALQNVLPADGPQRPVEGMEPAADATAGGDLFNQPTGEE